MIKMKPKTRRAVLLAAFIFAPQFFGLVGHLGHLILLPHLPPDLHTVDQYLVDVIAGIGYIMIAGCAVALCYSVWKRVVHGPKEQQTEAANTDAKDV